MNDMRAESVRAEVTDLRGLSYSDQFPPDARIGIRESADFDGAGEDPVASIRKIRRLFQ
jgi:hypothetical protein